jgi:glycosyltransferase involved in cell wall biosynthesis
MGFSRPRERTPGMRIAQVAPLFESVPPKLYGGTERVVSHLTESLVEQGHEVTLFATGDSTTRARLVPGWPRGLRLDGRSREHDAPHDRQLAEVLRMREQFDVIHFHTDFRQAELIRRYRLPAITTLHGRLDLPEVAQAVRDYPELPLVSISDAQRAPVPRANWLATVHHGLPRNLLQGRTGRGQYLAFLGRISPEKRCDRAIEIAKRLNLPLRIGAKIDPLDQAYYAERIEPLMAHPLVKFVGEIGEHEKDEFLGNAIALLFPIDWPEPFGLVMIEAMACGTPVVAFRHGSVPEVLEDGVTGFIVDNIDDAVAATARCAQLDRRRIRARFEQRFSAERMAADYRRAYEQVIRRTAASAGSATARTVSAGAGAAAVPAAPHP